MTGLLGDLTFGLACLLVGGACGVVVGYRRGVARTWLLAVAVHLIATQAVHAQLTEAERALADRAEVDHAAACGQAWPGNGVGHYSPSGWDALASSFSPRLARDRTTTP